MTSPIPAEAPVVVELEDTFDDASLEMNEAGNGFRVGHVGGKFGVLAEPQRIEVAKAGMVVSTCKRVNLIEGAGITITAADVGAGDSADVTIAAGGGGASAVQYAAQTTPSVISTFPGMVSIPGCLITVTQLGTYLVEGWLTASRHPSHTTANLYMDVSTTGTVTQVQGTWEYGSTGSTWLVGTTAGTALPASSVIVYVKFRVQIKVTALASGQATFQLRFGSLAATSGDQVQCDNALMRVSKFA